MGGRGGTFQSVKTLEAKMNSVGDKMASLAQYAMPGRNYDEKKRTQYYKAQRQYNMLKAQVNDARNRIAAQQPSTTKKTQKTFVNSYGEATTRYIASRTYEQQQKRLSKEIMNRLK